MTNGRDPVALIAIARGLEDEGRYLAARLFRAAASSEETRSSENRPRSNEDIARAIDAILPGLQVAGHDPALIAAMQRVARMLRAGEERFDGDMAEVHVCHVCGRELVGDTPDSCPSCGAGALSFERVLPIYYFLEPLPTERLVATLAAFPERVVQLCAGLSEKRANTGDWPLREIVSHLLGAQRLLGGRAIRTLDEDVPELRSVPSAAVTIAAEQRPSFDDLIADLRTGRQDLVRRFAEITPEQWQRIGRHGEWGPITIQQQLSYLARHEHSHLGHLARAAGQAA